MKFNGLQHHSSKELMVLITIHTLSDHIKYHIYTLGEIICILATHTSLRYS